MNFPWIHNLSKGEQVVNSRKYDNAIKNQQDVINCQSYLPCHHFTNYPQRLAPQFLQIRHPS